MTQDMGAPTDGLSQAEPVARLGPSGFDPSRIACAACRARGKTWQGSDPNCAFPNGGEFNPDNWNCATANMIRDLMPRWEDPISDKVNGPHWNEDQYWATVNLVGNLSETLAEDDIWQTLWVSWYKSRGRTEAMWLLSENNPPRRPTEAEAVMIAEAIAMEARKGGDGETRLHAKHDSAGPQGHRPSPRSIVEGN